MSSLPIDPRLARVLAPWEFFGGCTCIACAAIRELREASGRVRRLFQEPIKAFARRPTPTDLFPDMPGPPPRPMNRHQRRVMQAQRVAPRR